MTLNINAPQVLKDLPGWLIWRYEPNGNKKPRKVPYYADGGRRHGVQGRPEDRNQLTSFDEAIAAGQKRGFDGVGFAPLPEFQVVALDFDNCITPAGEIHDGLGEILGDSYAELSPSKRGIRALFRGSLGDLKAHGEPFGFEVFSTKGFVTITGDVLPGCEAMGNADTVAPVTPAVEALCRARFKRELVAQTLSEESNEMPVGLTPAQLKECLDVLPEDMDYDKWVSVGMAIHHETQGEGFDLWDEWSQRSPKYTDREYGVERWNSFGKGAGRIVTARSLVRMANENGARINLNGPASMDEFEDMGVATPDDHEFPDESNGQPAVAKKQRFQLTQAADFASGASPKWLIKHVVPDAELVVMFGESGSGKSFMALDMSFHIAQGLPWREKKTRKGKIVYIAAEGAGGFRNRLKAYAMHHQLNLADVDVYIIDAAPNFMLKEDALDVCKAVLALGLDNIAMVVVDTFAQVMPGANENSGEDVGKALRHAKGIHKALKCAVMLVHHAGKDTTKGARGWSGLRAAADAEIEVVRSGNARALRLSKSKDGEDGTIFGFALETVNLDIDEDGDMITSCVVIEAANTLPGPTKVRKDLGPLEKLVNDVIQEFAKDQTAGIEVEAVVKEAVARFAKVDDGLDRTRRDRVKRSLNGLCKGDDSPYWIEDDNTLTIQ